MSQFTRLDKSTSPVAKALPAAGASNYTTSVDITGGGDVKPCELKIVAPAVDNLVATKTIIYTLYESADNSTFAVAPWAGTVTQTGATGNGAAAASLRVGIPSDAKRYVRLLAAVLTAGGDNTGDSYSLEVYV